MIEKTTAQIAEDLGLILDATSIEGHEAAVRVYKGAKQIFIGTDEAVRTFLAGYEKERPGLMEASMYGYRE